MSPSSKDIPWYRRLDEYLSQIQEAKAQLATLAEKLDVIPLSLVQNVFPELIAHMVHESNWNEGIQVAEGRTKELAGGVFDKMATDPWPSLDMRAVIKFHRLHITKLQRGGASPDELATANLTATYMASMSVLFARLIRYRAAQYQLGKKLKDLAKSKTPPEQASKYAVASESLLDLRDQEEVSVFFPLTRGKNSVGAMVRELANLPEQELTSKLHTEDLHFMHTLLLMGVVPRSQRGHWRRGQVTVGNPDIIFPPANAIPGLMETFCSSIDCMRSNDVPTAIKEAARVSYEFVRIHPYGDGNGRLARVLLNMMLPTGTPPTSICTGAKMRHRYRTALKRGDRGDLTPMIALVAMGVRDSYAKVIDSLRPGTLRLEDQPQRVWPWL